MKGHFWKDITWLVTRDSSSDTLPFQEHSWYPQACVSCCRVPKDGPTTSSVARTSSLPASALAGDGISSALTLSVVLLISCYLHVPESFQVQKQQFVCLFVCLFVFSKTSACCSGFVTYSPAGQDFLLYRTLLCVPG